MPGLLGVGFFVLNRMSKGDFTHALSPVFLKRRNYFAGKPACAQCFGRRDIAARTANVMEESVKVLDLVEKTKKSAEHLNGEIAKFKVES